MYTDYKIVEEREDANGDVYFQRVRYYQGEVSTQDEVNFETGNLEPVTRYRRNNMYEEIEYIYG